MKKIISLMIDENPVFVLLLGLCSTLAITTKVESAYLMGFCVLIVLVISNAIVSIIKKVVPEDVKIPVYILIIGTLVTILEILLEYYLKDLFNILGIYLPLIVVNCIILGRAISVASNSNIKNSIIDGLGIGLGYIIALVLIAFIREVFGSNTITLIDSLSTITGFKIIINVFPNCDLLPISFLVKPAGAFLVLGLMIALFNKIKGGHDNESN